MAKVTYNFDLTEFLETKEARGKKREIKRAVGDFLVSAVIDDMNNQTSSVTGRKFRQLDKDYRKLKEKAGKGGKANLEFLGDLKEAISFRERGDGIEIGVFGGVDALKAETHNLGTQPGVVPRRQFLPTNEEQGTRSTFRPQLRDEVKKIIKDIIGDDQGKGDS